MKNKVLEVKDLSFSYPDKSILHRLSFDVDAGDFMCIVGTNGTGKSTLLKLILNQLSPLEGEIKLLGTNSEKYKDFASIAYVSQKATNINRDFPATVEEVVSLGIVLKTHPYKESDSLVTVYFKDYGKMTLIARGVKKLKSKNASACQTAWR